MNIIAHSLWVRNVSGFEQRLPDNLNILQLESTALERTNSVTNIKIDVYALVRSVHESRVASNTRKRAALPAHSCDFTA